MYKQTSLCKCLVRKQIFFMKRKRKCLRCSAKITASKVSHLLYKFKWIKSLNGYDLYHRGPHLSQCKKKFFVLITH